MKASAGTTKATPRGFMNCLDKSRTGDTGGCNNADLQKDLMEAHVPYFRDHDPSTDDVSAPIFGPRLSLLNACLQDDDAIKPNNIISAVLFGLFVYLSPFWSFEGWGPVNAVFWTCLSAVFIEFNSGMFHIVFDNEKCNTLPGLGPLAIDFQKHHVQPAGITKLPVFEFLQQVHAPALIIIGVQFLLTYPCTMLRPFWFFNIFNVNMMFMCHRWSHILPKNNTPLVQWLTEHGFILSMREHIQHHKTYDCNFSIFTGWSNPFLNYATQKWLSAESLSWVPIYVAYFMTPTIAYHASGVVHGY
jgi:hypothetical protein